MNIEEKLKIATSALLSAEHYLDNDLAMPHDFIYAEVFKALHHLQEPTTYWRPMETAPRGSTPLLIKSLSGRVFVGKPSDDGWTDGTLWTHSDLCSGWMPIPEE